MPPQSLAVLRVFVCIINLRLAGKTDVPAISGELVHNQGFRRVAFCYYILKNFCACFLCDEGFTHKYCSSIYFFKLYGCYTLATVYSVHFLPTSYILKKCFYSCSCKLLLFIIFLPFYCSMGTHQRCTFPLLIMQ